MAVTITIGYPDRALGATFSGGSWEANLPLTQLNRALLATVARSTDATLASTKMDIDLGAAQQVGIAAVVNHNMTGSALWRVRAYSDAGYTTNEYDSGWLDVWPDTYVSGDLVWEDPAFWLGTTTDTGGSPATAVLRISTSPSWRYWRIELDDTTNPAGYVQMGRVLLARPVSIGTPAVGAQIGHYTGTTVSEATSGVELIDSRPIKREIRFSLPWVTGDDTRRLYDVEVLHGTAEQLFVLWDDGDSYDQRRYSFFGRLLELAPFEWITPTSQTKGYVIREVL